MRITCSNLVVMTRVAWSPLIQGVLVELVDMTMDAPLLFQRHLYVRSRHGHSRSEVELGRQHFRMVYSQDSLGGSLYTVLLTAPSGNDDGGREIVPGPAKHNTPTAHPEFELLQLPALNITSMSEEEDAKTVCELISE